MQNSKASMRIWERTEAVVEMLVALLAQRVSGRPADQRETDDGLLKRVGNECLRRLQLLQAAHTHRRRQRRRLTDVLEDLARGRLSCCGQVGAGFRQDLPR